MTHALNDAVARLSALPEAEQDRIAKWLLEELAADRGWDERFAASENALTELAEEARAELARCAATDLDPTRL